MFPPVYLRIARYASQVWLSFAWAWNLIFGEPPDVPWVDITDVGSSIRESVRASEGHKIHVFSISPKAHVRLLFGVFGKLCITCLHYVFMNALVSCHRFYEQVVLNDLDCHTRIYQSISLCVLSCFSVKTILNELWLQFICGQFSYLCATKIQPNVIRSPCSCAILSKNEWQLKVTSVSKTRSMLAVHHSAFWNEYIVFIIDQLFRATFFLPCLS